MVIDKIGNINNIIESKKARPAQSVNGAKPVADSIQISDEGIKAAEEARLAQIVKDTPDVRADKVNKLKEQIASGEYDKFINDDLLGKVAEKLVKGVFKD